MTPPPLPDNLRDWPRDPFAVLGMDPGGDKKAARRAYAVRIRQYKPEDAPAEFQRIREAYESVLQFIAWGLQSRTRLVTPEEVDRLIEGDRRGGEPTDGPADASGGTSGAGDDDGAAPPRSLEKILPPDAEAEARRHWQLAINGRHEQAYAGLRECREREPRQPETAARLFWLLTLFPSLQPDRRPIDWLYDGVRTCGPVHPLVELLRRQLAKDPTEAARPEYWQAVEGAIAEPVAMELCRFRWQACGQLQRFAAIRDDLEVLRPLVASSDPHRWIDLLLLALDFLAWSRDQEIIQAFAEYVEEAERSELDGPAVHEGLVRLDLLADAARGWRQLLTADDVPKRWTQLVPLIWMLSADQLRALLIPVFKQMAYSPEVALDHFDRMIACSPAAAFQLGTAIENCSYDYLERDDAAWDEESARAIVEDYIQRYGRFGYGVGRKRLLELCLEDCIEPGWFASVLASLRSFMGVDCAELAQEIDRDPAVRYIYLAVRIFLG